MWPEIEQLARAARDTDILRLFDEPGRAAAFSVRFDGMLFDYSKTALGLEARAALIRLAGTCDLAARRAAMFAGEPINQTEGRAVLHTALRNLTGGPVMVDGRDIMPGIHETRARMAAFAGDIRAGRITGAGGPITDVVNIGIGGSHLGPEMATLALAPCHDGPRCHFVSNVDGADIADTLAGLDPGRTLVIVESKTFTTIETMTNAATARDWMARGVDDPGAQFAAVSSAPERTADWGIAPERVRILPSAVGGGFGGKLDQSVQLPLAVAAWKLGRPVAALWNRPESLASSTKRHPARMRAALAADRSGRILGYRFDGDFDTGAYASWGPTVAGRVPVHAPGPYRVPAVLATSAAVYTDGPPAGAFRGFGVPQAAIAGEALMDRMADRLGIDRLEFRLANALRAGDPTATGQVIQASVGLAACLEALRPHWRGYLDECATANARGGPLRLGAGIGCMWYGCGNTSMSNPSVMRLGLKPDGSLVLYNGAVDIGQGSYTIMAQIAADALGAPLARIAQLCGDTDRTADAGKTSASRQTFVSGKASELAGRDLRARLLRLANAGDDAELEFADGRVLVRHDGREHVIELAGMAVDAEGDVLAGTGTFDPPTEPLDADGQGTPYATYAFAAQIALVAVDLELGTTRVLKMVAAHDVGRAVNPTLVEGQIHGGIAQGLGLALMEEYLPGRTENLHDYLIPTVGDMPEITCILVEDAEPLGPYGAKGIGEPALVPTAPAVLGAIRHAAGIDITRVPALPHRVRAAISARGEAVPPSPDVIPGRAAGGGTDPGPTSSSGCSGGDRTSLRGSRIGRAGARPSGMTTIESDAPGSAPE